MAVNSSPIRDLADLHIKTAMHRVGDVVELDIIRESHVLAVRATLTAPKPKRTVEGKTLGALLRGGVAPDL